MTAGGGERGPWARPGEGTRPEKGLGLSEPRPLPHLSAAHTASRIAPAGAPTAPHSCSPPTEWPACLPDTPTFPPAGCVVPFTSERNVTLLCYLKGKRKNLCVEIEAFLMLIQTEDRAALCARP